jgi:hypothetical protein
MPRRQLTPAELQELRQLAVQWGKIIARRAGTDHAPLGLDLDVLEPIAQAAADGLREGTLQTLLEQQATALGDRRPCPDCGRPCPIRHEVRTLHVQGGVPLQHHEPVCHCPDCRRDFFPPPARPPP